MERTRWIRIFESDWSFREIAKNLHNIRLVSKETGYREVPTDMKSFVEDYRKYRNGKLYYIGGEKEVGDYVFWVSANYWYELNSVHP